MSNHREGFDTNLLGNFYAYPSFQVSVSSKPSRTTKLIILQLKYGEPVPVTDQTPYGRSIPAAWQSKSSCCPHKV